MSRNNLKERYFEWLCSKVNCPSKYSMLMSFLYDKEFVYTMKLDGNRAEDGVNLRNDFGYELDIPGKIVHEYFDGCPCSVLEMMIALSMRCEEHIMCNPDLGDRTGDWFFGMINNLGLEEMTNDNFDITIVDKVISRLLKHQYARNGAGGLFTVNNGRDMRKADIWYQLNWYLATII